MCGFIGEVNFETPQQDKIFYANKQLKNRGPDSQKVGYINNDLKFEINKNFQIIQISILASHVYQFLNYQN